MFSIHHFAFIPTYCNVILTAAAAAAAAAVAAAAAAAAAAPAATAITATTAAQSTLIEAAVFHAKASS